MNVSLVHFVKPVAFLCMLGSGLTVKGQTPYKPAAYPTNIPVNYVRTWDVLRPQSDASAITVSAAVTDSRMTTQYLDGLGRPLQTVVKQGSMLTGQAGKDLISGHVYDQFGREAHQFLPSPAMPVNNLSLIDGMFKLNPFEQQAAAYATDYLQSPVTGQGQTYFYSQTKFEPSPLNRVTETFAPGNSWVGTSEQPLEANRRSVKVKYFTNTANDLVRIWDMTNHASVGEWGTLTTPSGNSGYYAAGELSKTITSDEHGKQVIEFQDKSGRTILKKVQLTAAADNGAGAGYAGWLCTYYIYDNIGNLRIVMQPNAIDRFYSTWGFNQTDLDRHAFRYEYDERNRMIRKHLPAANDIFYVYDLRDRLIMTRDGNMTGTNQWLVTKYDDMNRPIETGIWNNSGSAQYHWPLAKNTLLYPVTSGTYMIVSQTHYDDYAGLPAGLTGTFDNSWSAEMYSSSSSASLYAQPLVATSSIRNKVGWTRSKVLSTANDYLYSVNIYDEKDRLIQMKTTNVTGGTDIVTTQYSWAGQPLISVNYTHIAGTPVQHITQVTRYDYDDLSRLKTTEKKLSYGPPPGASLAATPYVTISELRYDAIGQLTEKTIGNKKNSAGEYPTTRIPLESLKYDYNIRGWQLGMNRDMAKEGAGGRYFGYDIGYDVAEIRKADQSEVGQYGNTVFNGNISGISWRSAGDQVMRKYDYAYDAANRLLRADFTQKITDTWSNSEMNFNVKMGDGVSPSTAYDPNGNIKRMQQWGYRLGGSLQIDDLTYAYAGNRINSVSESATIGTTNHGLGDFTDQYHQQGNEYGYDRNGNMVTDLNKNIVGAVGAAVSTGGIRYNHLNLPREVIISTDVTGAVQKGTINWLYNAEGVKLEKKVIEDNVTVVHNESSLITKITTYTRYLNGLVLESKEYTNGTLNTALGYTNRLQFAGHEEGRARAIFQTSNPTVFDRFEYDYMIKDHLGNVRMVLTEEVKQDAYPAATMETAQAATEDMFYANLSATRIDRPSGYPLDTTYSNPNNKVAKVNGGGNKIGPAMLLKVMAGDKFHLKASAWWSGSAGGSNTSPLTSIVSALIGSAPGMSGGKLNPADLTSTVLDPQVSAFLASQPGVSGKPKAYLNWVLFDEQFKFVGSSSGAEPVESSGVVKEFNITCMPVDKNGYLYIYVSNETNSDVFFDNLQVTHVRGNLLEESHYYPFGLTMAGISSKALSFGGPDNKRGYNGNEIQENEFSDGSGLDVYDFNARTYDQQIGRFIQIDPLASEGGQEVLTPYQFGWNDPVKNADPDGKCPSCFIGAFVGFVVDATIQVGVSIGKSVANGKAPTLASIWNDYDGKQGLAAASAGFVTGGISAYEQGTAAMAKGVLANATFGAMEQVRTTGTVDPVNLVIDGFPMPDIKVHPPVNTSAAEKVVRQAENSIESSTSKVPQRKIDQLSEAQSNLNQQKNVNEGFKSTVTSSTETSTKNVAKLYNDAKPPSPGTVPVTMPRYDTRPTSDNLRTPRPFIPLPPK
ncbi:MAG: DUF6443 domain-containing protein [Chitinophagaceae bacterium]